MARTPPGDGKAWVEARPEAGDSAWNTAALRWKDGLILDMRFVLGARARNKKVKDICVGPDVAPHNRRTTTSELNATSTPPIKAGFVQTCDALSRHFLPRQGNTCRERQE
ncbi:MAG: hypothetical protein VB101_00955 [Rhodospirillaceae bacterium]|nr:hypothetical protein [Rhodospirillaceae bacterium]